MKRIDYFWPRAATQISGIVFISQAIIEVIGVRKEGFEWVFPACAIAFAISCTLTIASIVWNAIRARGELK
jgi:hypothetical protein